MKRSDVKYLYFISPIDNVPSIMDKGILSHNLARKISHHSVAMPEVQDRRRNKVIPGAGKLHDYANLYVNARNPMMYARKEQHISLCVLAVDPRILDETGVIMSDMNASRGIAFFSSPVILLPKLKAEEIFAHWWLHEDSIEQDRHKGVMCAEVLVPERVKPQFIRGAFVSCAEGESTLKKLYPLLKTKIDGEMFFQ